MMKMPWPRSGGHDDDDDQNAIAQEPRQWQDQARQHASSLLDPRVLVASSILTIFSLASTTVYKRHLRRIPSAQHIKPGMLRSKTIFGHVTRIGDGDNFRLYHTPGGRFTGWGWFPGRSVPTRRDELSGQTIHVRLAGIDAPELAHFGKPAQPYGQEALDFLRSYLSNQTVRAKIWRKDQYERVVATVYVRRALVGFLFPRDVSLEMLKRGLATVYEAKFGAEFGSMEQRYRQAEDTAKRQNVGMWKETSVWNRILGRSRAVETPRAYKNRMVRNEWEPERGKGRNNEKSIGRGVLQRGANSCK